jgi:hypothetical protein
LLCIDRLRVGPQAVARTGADKHRRRGPGRAVRLKQAAQPGDVRLDRGRGVVGRVVAPQLVRDPVDRDRTSALGDQQGEQRALQVAAETDLAPVPLDQERAEDRVPRHGSAG